MVSAEIPGLLGAQTAEAEAPLPAALGRVMVAPWGQELSYEAWKGPHHERSQAPVLSPRSRATPPGEVLRSVINGSPRRPPLLGSPLMDPYGSRGSAPGRLCAPPLDALRSGSVSPTVAMHKPRDRKTILTGGPKRAGSPWDRIRSRNPSPPGSHIPDHPLGVPSMAIPLGRDLRFSLYSSTTSMELCVSWSESYVLE